MDVQLLQGLVFIAVPLLLSLTVHEFAHARTALAFGDPTAKSMGRCSLNPLVHLDPIGTLMILFVRFGYARAVPVNMANLHPRRLGSISVSAAGPLSNLALAAACAAILRLMHAWGATVDASAGARFVWMDVVVFMLTYTVLLNLTLMIFNLLPLFPLDGHHIGRETLPAHLRAGYMQWQVKYGTWILLALIIGPRLLEAATRRAVFSPLGWYYAKTIYPLFMKLIGDNAIPLCYNAFDKFSGFTAFN